MNQAALDIAETLQDVRQDWLESIHYILDAYGEEGVREVLRSVQNHVLSLGVPLNEATLNTPYINSIPLARQPMYPGDIELEKRIENIIRWNAMAMVLQAQDQQSGVGGHIATYTSAATMLEVGFNHFFRCRSEEYGGDLVLVQPHAAPGVYARAFLEGRLSEQQLANFRRELQPGGGLCSYPHPRSMPEFWQMPNASMGLSTPSAIYQARFAKYLEARGLKPANGGKIWCFIGDGEADEPEVMGTINIAARENLDNLVLVVNCNLQRLDGPVRGNGKIIQELERSFRGADWQVIKVIWGSGWDGLLASDRKGVLRRRMEECVDGDYQYFSILPGNVQREHWVENNPELKAMMNTLTDDEIRDIKRGGQDPKKVYAAFDRAGKSSGKPTVILVKTVKGDGMGKAAQGRNTAHQKKNLDESERLECARNYGIPLPEEDARKAAFYLPPEDSPEREYLMRRRQELGGHLPARVVDCPAIEAPSREEFAEFDAGSKGREVSTTMVVVRILSRLLKSKSLGKFIVPIVPDEARTFGMDGLFGQAGIYSPQGQNYTPVDSDSLMVYREAKDGQILQEGICETGAIASFMAAGTAYAVHGVPMIPFYIFYSMFGFQRVGDMIWACGDMMCRGFLLGGTAGRTTLNGEGLQHQDGHSPLLAATVPNMKAYDPAFGFELAVIIRDGIDRMYRQGQNLLYYLTVYNENYPMPAMPDAENIEEGILRGAYCYRRGSGDGARINLLSSGAIMQQALAAAEHLEGLGYAVAIYSVTSFIELSREAEDCDRWNRLHPEAELRRSWLEQLLANEEGVFVSATDYMKSLPNMIAKWIPGPYTTLGTDGYGVSEARPELRRYFEVASADISFAALSALYRQGDIDLVTLEAQRTALDIDTDKFNPVSR
ncbi:pyruvate dehydrogenase (acetyl-transferring), homodimeric type [Spongiibacter taiwanensis]|uniref:pyruvate dehydrogenase (acetyl-transferring), homodimeric type n=1 Tax=Spongiibacter taiwanensis TaxID=1748242 RepID=UPI00203584D0|nr:pyruvate dehydrogenase (acetyl-transferring), homodimeric type [Spongiibacter taiwanensis]USA42653.1 pyruvate dehydrogenase (acetyl-transferring), homodimeric type [Spongiibacter taiwanensis]